MTMTWQNLDLAGSFIFLLYFGLELVWESYCASPHYEIGQTFAPCIYESFYTINLFDAYFCYIEVFGALKAFLSIKILDERSHKPKETIL
jgi:hypothetical protein